jgi:2-hydroxy-6-oxonona-2,4-dienedioate hydrolase
VDGHAVRYREAGSGPPLVLVHGLGVSADYWFRNGSTLADEGFRVLAPDLIGFGRTPARRPEAAEGPLRQAAMLAHWADALEIGPAVFIGHSLSCQTIVELAARQPERVRGLVLAAPTGSGSPLQRLRQLTQLALDGTREPPQLITTVGLAYLRAGPLRVFRTWWQGAKHDPLRPASSVSVWGVVIVGTRDPIVVPEFARTLAERLRGGWVEWIDGGTHAVHFSRPVEFNRIVADFARASQGSGR